MGWEPQVVQDDSDGDRDEEVEVQRAQCDPRTRWDRGRRDWGPTEGGTRAGRIQVSVDLLTLFGTRQGFEDPFQSPGEEGPEWTRQGPTPTDKGPVSGPP